MAANGIPSASRVHGKGRLLRSLRALLRRVEKFNAYRAQSHHEHVWACTLADQLQTAYDDALLDAGALLSLQAVDQRAEIARKVVR